MKSSTIYKTSLTSFLAVFKSANIYKTGLTSVIAASPFILFYLLAEAKAFNELSSCVNCYSYQPYTDQWGEKLSPFIESDRLMAINLSLTIDTIKQAIQAVEDGEGGFVVANILADYYVDNNIDAYRLLNELNWESALKI